MYQGRSMSMYIQLTLGFPYFLGGTSEKNHPVNQKKRKKDKLTQISMLTMSFFKSKSIKYWIDKVELQVKWFPIKRVPDVVRFIHHWCGEWSAPGEKHQPGASSYPDLPTHINDEWSIPFPLPLFYSSSDTRVTSRKSTLLGAHMHWVPAATKTLVCINCNVISKPTNTHTSTPFINLPRGYMCV